MVSGTYVLPRARLFVETRESTLESLLPAFLLTLSVALGFAAFSPECVHWFLIPVVICGTIACTDALSWLRGRIDLMDPIGLMGMVGCHFFFLAPLLHVAWNYWSTTAPAPEDWRGWIGAMATLNALGLAAYRMTSRPNWKFTVPKVLAWKLSRSRFSVVIVLVLVLSAGAQLGVYASFGGVSGYIETYRAHPENFRGTGWLFMVSETFPLLALMAFLVCVRRRPVVWKDIHIVGVLFAFFVVQMLFGGLRGSRSNTVWALIWAAGMIHFWVQPIRRSLVFGGCIFLVTFLYAYGFYKEYSGAANIAQTIKIAKKHDRSLAAALLGDLGRADIQAFLLYRLIGTNSDYELEWGRTYLGAPALLIPRSIWPDRPPTTVKAGTEIQHYVGSYTPDRFESSRVYGMAGEAMLNFGPLAVPVAFFLLGLVVRGVRSFLVRAVPLDSRLLVAPLAVEICIWLLIGDSALIMFSVLKQGFMPCAVVFAASRKVVIT